MEKSNGLAHWYQLNYEKFFKENYDKSVYNDSKNEILTRDECDQHNITLPNAESSYNFYTIAASSLYSGLDMNVVFYYQLYMNDSLLDPLDTLTRDDIINPANNIVVDFFNKNVDENPLTATNAFCALHDGLDAADTRRFAINQFNSGSNCNPTPKYFAPDTTLPANDARNLNCGSSRCIKIAKSKEKYGAVQNDAPAAQGAPIHQRNNAEAMNDAGWYIQEGNYEKFLHQINPVINNQSLSDPNNTTSIGYGNKIFNDANTSDTDYNNLIFGRFARGFDVDDGKNAFYFDIDDTFLKSAVKCGNQNASSGIIKVTYLDSGEAKWQLFYDGLKTDGGFVLSSFPTVTNGNTDTWKTQQFTISCSARFKNGCGYHSDFFIKGMNNRNGIFAMVEFKTEKDSQDTANNSDDKNAALIITPNPSTNYFSVKLDNDAAMESIQIYNLIGQKVLNKYIGNNIA